MGMSSYFAPEKLPPYVMKLLVNLEPAKLLGNLKKLKVVGHYFPFDYRMLFKTFGLAPLPRVYDTMTMGQMVAWCESLSLENMYKQFVGKEFNPFMKRMKENRSKFWQLDLVSQAKYARGDAELTLELFEVLLPLYKEQVNKKIRNETMAFTELVQKMVQRGLPINMKTIVPTAVIEESARLVGGSLAERNINLK